MYNFEADVLVVGGGGGGAMAAYEATKHGVSVMMALKGRPQRCGSTIMAPGAIAGVGNWKEPGDSRDSHFMDTVKGGAFLNEQGLVRIMVEEAPELILELERIGALWERKGDNKTYALRGGGGHSWDRSCFLEDRVGREMLRTLTGELRKRNVRILPDVMILKLLKDGGRIAGAVGLNLENCVPVLLRAKVVCVACGGAGNIYLNTDNPTDVTGDGYALALEAGAELMDMEFVQFFPLGFCFPPSLRGALAALPYHIRLRNSRGDRFMEKYDAQRLEMSTRDKVSRAMLTEVWEGRGGPHGGVFADMTYHDPGFLHRMQPALYETYLKIGVNPEEDYLEVAPTCHFFMGGAKVDENWQSTIPGLFMVGENAAGIHGANRLSQNALAELLVSGRRAGREAARLAAKMDQPRVQPQEALAVAAATEGMFNLEEGERPVVLRNRLRNLMWEKAGVYRSGEELERALEALALLTSRLGEQHVVMKSRHYNKELIEGFENRFMAAVAKCVLEAAYRRTESRGAHFRDDYPETNNEAWLKHLIIRQADGELRFRTEPVDLEETLPEEEIA